MNMEDCPVHHIEANPPYPFTCPCKEDFTDKEWKNVARHEYHGWAAWGEYHPWVRENEKGHQRYVKMLWDYSFMQEKTLRRWLLRLLADEIETLDMSQEQILERLREVADMEFFDGTEDEDE